MEKYSPPKFYVEGKEISFSKFLSEMGGSGVVYERDIEKILKQWKSADWVYAIDYIAPIATQVIADAAEVNREVSTELMKTLVVAYDKMQNDLALKPTLKRIK